MIEDALIVMPAYNEAKVIGQTLDELSRVCPRVLVVDDGSSDATSEVAREHGAESLRLPTNLGYGGALQAGFRFAIRETDLPHVVTFDADGQHDPAYIEDLLAPVRSKEADYVVGSRYLIEDGRADSMARDLGIRLFARGASLILGRKITDPTSGMIAMTREVAKIFLLDLFPQDYPDADVIIMLDKMGLAHAEVPVKIRQSQSGKSMHGGLLGPLYYVYKMSLSMINLATRSDLPQKRKEANIAG